MTKKVIGGLGTILLVVALSVPAMAGHGNSKGKGGGSGHLPNGRPFQELEAQIVALQGQVATLQAQLQTVEGVLNSTNFKNVYAMGQFVTVDTDNTINGVLPPHVIFNGANVHVQSGTGVTADTTSGLGNLIVGYDEVPLGTMGRLGSNNLIVGPGNNFSSYGGFVAGANNSVMAPGASVSGGVNNVASGDNASVSGGDTNVASSTESSVAGGECNVAGANASQACTPSVAGEAASVAGGLQNSATGIAAVVSGGSSNIASGNGSSIGGGTAQTEATANTNLN